MEDFKNLLDFLRKEVKEQSTRLHGGGKFQPQDAELGYYLSGYTLFMSLLCLMDEIGEKGLSQILENVLGGQMGGGQRQIGFKARGMQPPYGWPQMVAELMPGIAPPGPVMPQAKRGVPGTGPSRSEYEYRDDGRQYPRSEMDAEAYDMDEAEAAEEARRGVPGTGTRQDYERVDEMEMRRGVKRTPGPDRRKRRGGRRYPARSEYAAEQAYAEAYNMAYDRAYEEARAEMDAYYDAMDEARDGTRGAVDGAEMARRGSRRTGRFIKPDAEAYRDAQPSGMDRGPRMEARMDTPRMDTRMDTRMDSPRMMDEAPRNEARMDTRNVDEMVDEAMRRQEQRRQEMERRQAEMERTTQEAYMRGMDAAARLDARADTRSDARADTRDETSKRGVPGSANPGMR